MKRALFVDFEDSFTYNVVQELVELGLVVEVIHWTKFNPLSLHDLLVLGPGPGHPDDYSEMFPSIRQWQSCGKKIFGLCLGHQILLSLLGYEVKKSKFPLHGQKIELSLPTNWQTKLSLPSRIWVQRYNSLAVMDIEVNESVESFTSNGEVMMALGENFLSYQFHPESMGTKCRQSFFRPIFKFLL